MSTTMLYECKKCAHPVFNTKEQLKNHSRIHAAVCKVKFPLDSYGLQEEATLHREDTELFKCPRCMRFESKYPAKIQIHCKACKEVDSRTPLGRTNFEVFVPTQPFIPTRDDHESYIESKLGFFVNKYLSIAICRTCKCVVEAGSIGQHATRKHGLKVDLERLSLDITKFQLHSGIESLASYRIHTAALKDPIEGLEVVDGFGCKLCIFYSRKLSTLKVHLRTAHESNCSIQGSHQACFVQRLFRSPGNNSWFGVSQPIGNIAHHGTLMDAIRREAEERRKETPMVSYNESRQLPLFIKRLNWDQFIQNLDQDIGTMAALISAPRQGDAHFFPTRLREVCRSLMFDFQYNNGTAEPLLRKKVKSTKAVDTSTDYFSRLEQSSEDYVATLVHLINLLLRSLDGDNNDDDEDDILSILVPLDEPLQHSLQNLWNGLHMEDEDGQFTAEYIGFSKSHCLQVLEDLFFIQRPSHLILETSLLVYRFVVFTAIQHHHVITADEVTQRISRLMYWCRSLVLYKIVYTPKLATDGTNEVEESFLLFVREGYRTPFAAILEAKRLIFKVTKNEMILPNVVWAGDGQLVDGVYVDIQGISNMIHESTKELYRELKRDLLFDMPEYHLNKDRILQSKTGSGIEDNLRENSAGYWFIWNKNNHCSNYTLALIHHIVTNETLRCHFIDSIEDISSKIIWNQGALNSWLNKVGKWLQKLLCIIHLIAGQPGRGVEILSCTIRNTSTQIRGVYFVDGLVMLLSLYGKADNLRGTQRPIARFLCKDTSFLLINYLTYVREMEIVASKVLYKEDQTTLYNQLLAVKEGQALSSRDLSEGISRMFLTHLKVAQPLNSWRHMAIAWMDRFLKYTNVLELTCNGPLDSQAGHSQQTASRIYGRSNFDHPSIGRDEFQLYRLASVEWHKLLHLVSDSLPSYQALVKEKEDGTVISPITTDVHHHHHHQIKVVHSLGDIGIDFPSLSCSELVLRGLLSLGYNKFKSPHQAQAIHRIVVQQEDLLVVLPTGGGKTLLFLLPSLVESGCYTTVVICPLVALKKDMLHRLQNAKISIQVYSESLAPGIVDILLVSVEHCLSQAFQNHLGYLYKEGRLRRIVVDECHLALTSSSWRPAIHDLKYIRKVPVPLLLLSATVPPNMEDLLKEFFNSHLSIVRSPTNRPNIVYQVIKTQGPLEDTLVKLLLDLGPTIPKSIIFSRGREQTKTLAELLCTQGLTTVYYHGHLDEKSRNEAQDLWMYGKVDIMVATGAFGAGIDISTVRLIIHMDEPYSMIDLAQESGRGGRDGLPSKHIILLPILQQSHEETCTKLVEFLSGLKCRRWVLQDYIDGCGFDCFSSGSEKCDVCQSIAMRIQPTNITTGLASSTTNYYSEDMDLFADMDDAAFEMLEEPPTKRICLGNALLSTTTDEAQDQYRNLMLTFLNLVQFLKGAKDKCILCAINQQHDSHHSISQCPYVRNLCFKCLAPGHGSSNCPNRLQWKANQCFGCGLPNTLGQQVMHPERFGPGCRSMGHDKMVPACWYFWRNSERFNGILKNSSCPLYINDYKFAEWLTNPNGEYRSNAIYLLILYVNTLK